jgi:hypothetical protein
MTRDDLKVGMETSFKELDKVKGIDELFIYLDCDEGSNKNGDCNGRIMAICTEPPKDKEYRGRDGYVCCFHIGHHPFDMVDC